MNEEKVERLYLSPFRYAQVWAVEKLREYIESKGGVIVNRYIKPTEIIIVSGNPGEEPSEDLKRRHPVFVAKCVSWSGWQINFDYEGHHYEVWGDGNPFFPVYALKEPIGDKYRRYGIEFHAFAIHGYNDHPTDYSKENPEEEFTPEIFNALVALPDGERVVNRKRRYYTEVEYEMKGGYR